MTPANPRFDYQHALRVFLIFFVLLQIVFVAIYTARNPGIVDALKFNFWYAVILSLFSTLYLSYSNRLYKQTFTIGGTNGIAEKLKQNTIRGVKIKEVSDHEFLAGFGYMSAHVKIIIADDKIHFNGPKHFIRQLAEVLKLEEE